MTASATDLPAGLRLLRRDLASALFLLLPGPVLGGVLVWMTPTRARDSVQSILGYISLGGWIAGAVVLCLVLLAVLLRRRYGTHNRREEDADGTPPGTKRVRELSERALGFAIGATLMLLGTELMLGLFDAPNLLTGEPRSQAAILIGAVGTMFATMLIAATLFALHGLAETLRRPPADTDPRPLRRPLLPIAIGLAALFAVVVGLADRALFSTLFAQLVGFSVPLFTAVAIGEIIAVLLRRPEAKA